jgi:group I intron endonuclease
METFKGVVYRTTNLRNGKWYIGKDETNNPKYLGSEISLAREIAKYGESAFVKEILCYASSVEELSILEKKYIEELKAYKDTNSYNVSDQSRDEDTFRENAFKTGVLFRGKTKTQWEMYDCEKKTDISEKISSKHKGKSLSIQTKEKISQANLKNADARGEKISTSLRLFWSSEEGNAAKENLRKKCKKVGEENGFFGKSHSPESIQKIKQSKLGKAGNKKITDAEINDLLALWKKGDTITHLAKQFGVSRTSVYRYIKNSQIL